MAKPIQPVQDRSRRRRDDLLRSAIELLAWGGPKAVTHRAVATLARVPLATTTYYFDSIQQLIEEALRLHLQERMSELATFMAEASSEAATAEELARRFAGSLASESRPTAATWYEAYLEAARRPALQPALRDALAIFEEATRTALVALGAHHPAAGARDLVALLDGWMLHRLVRAGDDTDGLFEALRCLLVIHLAEDRGVEVASRQPRPPLAS